MRLVLALLSLLLVGCVRVGLLGSHFFAVGFSGVWVHLRWGGGESTPTSLSLEEPPCNWSHGALRRRMAHFLDTKKVATRSQNNQRLPPR